MGDIADMMLEGILCESCGDLVNETPLGYPTHCGACAAEDEEGNNEDY